jgi:hypothetical protein
MLIVRGYCPSSGHSTSTMTALVGVIEDLRSSMTKERVTVLVPLDFSKAFDCVDYRLFLHKLVSSFDFYGSARDMVFTFLNGRSIVVHGWYQIVHTCLVFRCAPWFCAFATFLFMFVNCLSERICNSKFQFYADDLHELRSSR